MTNRLVPVSTDLRRHSVIYMLQLFPFTLLVYGVLMDPHVAFTHSIWVVNTEKDFPSLGILVGPWAFLCFSSYITRL